jgi:hypothetical protein
MKSKKFQNPENENNYFQEKNFPGRGALIMI